MTPSWRTVCATQFMTATRRHDDERSELRSRIPGEPTRHVVGADTHVVCADTHSKREFRERALISPGGFRSARESTGNQGKVARLRPLSISATRRAGFPRQVQRATGEAAGFRVFGSGGSGGLATMLPRLRNSEVGLSGRLVLWP